MAPLTLNNLGLQVLRAVVQERDNLRALIDAFRRAVAADLPPPVQVLRLLGATQQHAHACDPMVT